MLYRQMKYFVAVVECGSFTEAAERCFISQSAISQQIKALEDKLGVILLKREKRSFTLTQAGEHFYRESLIMIDETERLIREIRELGKGSDNELKVGFLRCYGGQEFKDTVAEFTSKYPDVRLEVVYGNHEELYDLLRFGKVDLVLNDQRRAFSDDYINFELVRAMCHVEVSAYSNFANLDYITFRELKKVPCILVSSREQQKTEADFYRITLEFTGDFIFAETLEEARMLAAANKGFLPIESNVMCCNGSLKCLKLLSNDRQMYRNYCAFWRKENVNPYTPLFADMLR